MWKSTHRNRNYNFLPSTLASSTKIISFSSIAGEVYITLWTVLSRVDQASLWKTMITLVLGSGGQRLNFCSMHLEKKTEFIELKMSNTVQHNTILLRMDQYLIEIRNICEVWYHDLIRIHSCSYSHNSVMGTVILKILWPWHLQQNF